MVTGVEEYFKILEELQKNNTTLPINIQSGESFFDVDLNDRLIIVPPEFKKYIAVQRDHNIETIYFRVDRYFDTTDLSELTCVVQFTNARKESGIHLVSEKDLTTYSSDGKMILGWKLNRDFTQYPGTVTYSLRFYKLDENKKFIYDLHTIPAIGIIAPGLDTLEDTNAEEDTKPVANLITDLINRVDYACGPEMNGMMKNNINEYFAENPVKEEIQEYITNHQVVSDDQVDNAVHDYLTANPPTGGATNVQVEEAVNGYFERNDIDGRINELLDENGVNKAVENINDIGEYSYDVEVELEYQLETGGFYNYNSGNIQETNSSNYSHGVIDLAEHQEIKKIHLDGETYYQVGLIFITDENDKKLYSYPDNPDSYGIKVSIDVNLPDNARYIYYSTVSSKDFTLSFFKGRYILSNVATKEQLDNLLKRVDVKSYKKEEVEFEYKTGVYLNKNGSTTEADGWLTSKLINVAEGETYYITAKAQWKVVCYALFDNNGRFISYDGYNDGSLVELNDYELVIPDGIYNIRICGKDGYFGLKKKVKQTIAEKVNQLTDELDNTKEKEIGYGNVLYSKKYVACGDSFTEGDFTSFTDKDGLSGKDSPVIYDTNRKMYKTYPWWIAERNNMTLVNEAKCGSDFTNVDGASNPFSVSRYQEVPTDADYITLMFGLNETGLTDEQIGTNTDTDNTTLWGAYNIVFEYFLTNMPYAKIGVILADAWMPTKYSNAVKEICKYWGISYLDLKDDNIPMGIGGKNISVSDKAKELRNSAFKVSSTNGHPNVKAHEYRSTIIENFLRSL